MPCLVKAAVLQHRNLRKIRKKIEVEKSGLEDKIEIGSLSTIQLETERHIVEIFFVVTLYFITEGLGPP